MKRLACALVAVFAASALAPACVQHAYVEEGSPSPILGGDAGDTGALDASAAGLCATAECPEGRTTCPNDSFPCAVDLLSDNDNCGACGLRCPRDQEFTQRYGALTECIDGECRLFCTTGRADCNGLVEDGCELDTRTDTNNCGGCGITCADVCIAGTCGCGPDLTFCSADCVNVENHPLHCGECGHACPPSTQPPSEWHATRTCAQGECDELVCIVEPPSEIYPRLRVWADCDGDLFEASGNGCERTLGTIDDCGGCGKKCAPGETCRTTLTGGECVCACGSPCFDVNSDVDNCGSCGFVCPGDRRSIAPNLRLLDDPDPAHGRPVCDQGICDYRCSPHWADCDGDSQNGCETNLLEDPRNCGGCGIECNGTNGQPCLEGKCATKECPVVR